MRTTECDTLAERGSLSIPDQPMQGTAADLLTPTGAVIAVTASIDAAEQRLVTLGASELYVVGTEGQLAGVLPDYVLLKRRIAGETRPNGVADLMSRIDVCAASDTPLRELAVQLRQSGLARIPVVARGRLIGEVTRSNLLRFLATNVARGANRAAETATSPARRTSTNAPRFLRASQVHLRSVDVPAGAGIANTT